MASLAGVRGPSFRVRSITPWLLAISTAAFVSLGGCTKKALPTDLQGHFEKTEKNMLGFVKTSAELRLSETGFVFSGAGGLLGLQGFEVGTGGQTVKGHVGDDGNVTGLFEEVSCDQKTACRFKTKVCEGTLTKEPTGNLTIVATGECARISGDWLTDENAKAAKAASPSFSLPQGLTLP